jgi:hypothetical protein
MEIPPRQIEKRTEVNVNRASETVPTGESFFLLTFEIPERVADILEVESHTTL